MTNAAPTPEPNVICNEDFSSVADMLKQFTGIHLTQNKKAMVAGRLLRRLREKRLNSISDYLSALKSPGNEDERDAFISALTTNITRFHREAHQFAHLSQSILPKLLETARSGGRVRIWSAGCSSGEEAYDLAFQVLKLFPEAHQKDIRILATDVDKTALSDASRGEYPASGLIQLPEDFVQLFFDQPTDIPDVARVKDVPRSLIAFRQLNLHADWPFHGKFDVIMCRNVAIYFDANMQTRLWQRLVGQLQPGGVLYMGHSETLPAELLACAEQEGMGIYRFGTSVLAPGKDKFSLPSHGEVG